MLKYVAAFFRIVVIACLLFVVAALAVARIDPVDARSGARVAGRWLPPSQGITPWAGSVELIDRVDGRTRTIAPPEGELWHLVAPSPWQDEEGVVEAVGRFTRPRLRGRNSSDSTYGLVRFRLPDAEVIERIDLDVLPTSRPAWSPVDDGHVLIGAGDGRLYSYRFAPRDEAAGLIATPERQATVGADLVAVEWECPTPGSAEPYLSDPVWPTIPEMQNLVVVSLSTTTAGPGGEPRFGTTSPWWLELSFDGERIVAAGPLIDPSDDPDAAVDVLRRFPSVERRDGRLQLAYLVFRGGGSEAEPRVGDLVRRPTDGRLSLRFGGAAKRATGWFPIEPWRVPSEALATAGWTGGLGLTGLAPPAIIPGFLP
jgi:hypothetical protein